jgi:hypothetical protein
VTEPQRNLHLDLKIAEAYFSKEKPTKVETEAFLREARASWPQALRRAIYAEEELKRTQIMYRNAEKARDKLKARVR